MARKVVNIGGVPITVISDNESEKADYVVCMPVGPSPFSDNLTAFCCECGIKLMHRWHVPRKPKKICIECALKLSQGNQKEIEK
jgi:hypothetical protein